jgi:hypothetical protein
VAPTDLVAGVVYSWEKLGEHFDFKPAYLSAAGGMPVSTGTDSLLLITHPSGGKAFDYGDYWDGDGSGLHRARQNRRPRAHRT